MYSLLFEIYGFKINSYGFVTVIACCFSTWCVVKNRPIFMNLNDIVNFCLITLFAIFFTDKTIYLINNNLSFDFFDFINLRNQPLHSFYSTLWITLISITLYCIIKKKPVGESLDFLLYYAIPALAIQRIFGCFMAGCCYGRPTDLPWGICFPKNSPAGMAYSVPIHPTQLYYGFSALFVFWSLYFYKKKNPSHRSGNVFAFGLMGLSLSYFIVSFFRGDHIHNGDWNIVKSTCVSSGTFLTGLLIYLKRNSRYVKQKFKLPLYITLPLYIFFMSSTHAADLSIKRTPYSYIKWGNVMSLDISADNPCKLECDGSLTVSFGSKVIVIKKDKYGKELKPKAILYNQDNQLFRLKFHLVIRNYYHRWMPFEKKQMNLKFIPIETGLLKILVRATCNSSLRTHTIKSMNIPENSSTVDEFGFPVQTCNIFVKESPDFYSNFLLLSKYNSIFFSKEFNQNFQTLLEDPTNISALSLFGIVDSQKNAIKQISILKTIIGDNPYIKKSPALLLNVKKIIEEPTNIDAQEFFGIIAPRTKIAKQKIDIQLTPQKNAEGFILMHQGGATLMEKIRSSNNIRFIPPESDDIISVICQEKTYSFKKSETIVYDIAIKLDQIKPNENFSEVIDILKNTNNTFTPENIYISYLNFFDPVKKKSLPQNINELIESQITQCVKNVLYKYQYLYYNKTQHRIENTPENMNNLISIVLNKDATAKEKREQIVHKLLLPNHCDAILSGLYIIREENQIELSIFLIVSTKSKIIRSHIFTENELFCKSIDTSQQTFCPEVNTILCNLINNIFNSL